MPAPDDASHSRENHEAAVPIFRATSFETLAEFIIGSRSARTRVASSSCEGMKPAAAQ